MDHLSPETTVAESLARRRSVSMLAVAGPRAGIAELWPPDGPMATTAEAKELSSRI